MIHLNYGNSVISRSVTSVSVCCGFRDLGMAATYGAVLDVIDEDEHGKLALDLALVLVDVGHDLLEGGDGPGEQLVVAVRPRRLAQDVVEQEERAGQPLHGPDEQLGEVLAAALGLALRDLEEGVEAGLQRLALRQRLLRLLVEVDERRVRLEQRLGLNNRYID